MTVPHFDCLSVGIIVADHLCDPLERLPDPGELVLTRRMELTIGGCAANVAVDLAKLGRNAALVGKVGDDVFGRHVQESLAALQVDCQWLGVAEQCDTAGTLIINCRGQDRRFIHSIGANGRFTGEEVSEEMISQAGCLYLGGYLLCDSLTAENVAALFRKAHALKVPTILDVVIGKAGEYLPRLAPVLPFTDVFLPNDDEARVMCGLSSPVDQAKLFRDMGAKTVVVTRGSHGAVMATEDGLFRSSVHRVEFVDGTGSGDAFAAGWIHGRIRSADPFDCLRFGSALGASCVTRMGATEGVLGADELEAFVAEHPLTIDRIDA